jgi:hypothetical protein
MGPAESLVMRANQLVDEACKQWGHAGEMIIDPPEYCARCGKSAAVISDAAFLKLKVEHPELARSRIA